MDIELSYKAKQVMADCISLAQQAFERSFPIPSITFNVRGKAAGKAYLQLNQIRLNPILFRENPQAFLKEVIPHEVAHLITYQVYGRVRPTEKSGGASWNPYLVFLPTPHTALKLPQSRARRLNIVAAA